MDAHVTYEDPNGAIHGVTVRNVDSETAAIEAAGKLMNKVCEDKGLDFSEFEISVVEMEIPTEDYINYLHGLTDPRD